MFLILDHDETYQTLESQNTYSELLGTVRLNFLNLNLKSLQVNHPPFCSYSLNHEALKWLVY